MRHAARHHHSSGAVRPEVPTGNNEETVQLPCVLPVWCDARTCNDRYAAVPAQRLDDEVEGAEELGPSSAFRGEQPLSSPQSSLPRQWRRRRNSLVVTSLKVIPKNRRRVKLQAILLLINSKTIELQRVKTVIILQKMVVLGLGI